MIKETSGSAGMRIAAFVDLDDTLFQTRRKCPQSEPLRLATRLADGSPSSFMTSRQGALWEWLSRADALIPVTARSYDAFSRVALPFHHVKILDFGAVILLPDGSLDRQWDAIVRPRLRETAAPLREAVAEVERFVARERLDVRVRIVSDFDMPLYLVAKHNQDDAACLARIADELHPSLELSPFFLHLNDNNLSLAPKFLGKERAVRWVIDHHLGAEPWMTIGVGDSHTDAAFMANCDYALAPGGSQLARAWLCGGDLRV